MLAHSALLSALLLITSLTPESQCYTDVYIEGSQGASGVESSQQVPLWFGPRLGRRKRTSVEALIPKAPVLEESVVGLYDETPWLLEPIRGFQERPLAYSPYRERDVEEILENSKAPPFSPRLGRRRKLLPFSPRLGRDMRDDAAERFTRSASEEQAPKPH